MLRKLKLLVATLLTNCPVNAGLFFLKWRHPLKGLRTCHFGSEPLAKELHPRADFVSQARPPNSSWFCRPSPVGNVLGWGGTGGGDVKNGERENGRTVQVRAAEADPTSQLKRGTAGLHGKLPPARDRG